MSACVLVAARPCGHTAGAVELPPLLSVQLSGSGRACFGLQPCLWRRFHNAATRQGIGAQERRRGYGVAAMASAVTEVGVPNKDGDGASIPAPAPEILEELDTRPMLAGWMPPRYLWRAIAAFIIAGQVPQEALASSKLSLPCLSFQASQGHGGFSRPLTKKRSSIRLRNVIGSIHPFLALDFRCIFGAPYHLWWSMGGTTCAELKGLAFGKISAGRLLVTIR